MHQTAKNIRKRNPGIVGSPLDDWLRAVEQGHGVRRKVPGFGMMDSLVMAAAERAGGSILTGDPHFRKMANVMYLG